MPESARLSMAQNRLAASILIVEDNADLAANLADYLDAHGYLPDVAQDGVTGLHLAVANRYDAIVLDLTLPAWTASHPAPACAWTPRRVALVQSAVANCIAWRQTMSNLSALIHGVISIRSVGTEDATSLALHLKEAAMKALFLALLRYIAQVAASEGGELLSVRRKAHLLQHEMYTRLAQDSATTTQQKAVPTGMTHRHGTTRSRRLATEH